MLEPDLSNRRIPPAAAFLFVALAGLLFAIYLHPPNLVDLNQVSDFATGPGDTEEFSMSRPQVDPGIVAISQTHRISEEDVDSLLVTETNPARCAMRSPA